MIYNWMKEFVRIGDKIQGSWTHGKENNTCIMHKNYFATFLCTIHCNPKSWVFRGAAYHDHLGIPHTKEGTLEMQSCNDEH